MALSDPQSVTINGVAVSLPNTGRGPNSATYTSADRNTRLEVSHSVGARYRHLVKLRQDKIVANPLVPSQNIPVSASVHIVLDMPRNGVSTAELVALGDALVAWASSANLTKIVTGES